MVCAPTPAVHKKVKWNARTIWIRLVRLENAKTINGHLQHHVTVKTVARTKTNVVIAGMIRHNAMI